MRANIPANEIIEDRPIRCYDNGGKTFDRYTVLFIDEENRLKTGFEGVGMSSNPFHPQGFGMQISGQPGFHLGVRVPFVSLPKDCQKYVKQCLG